MKRFWMKWIIYACAAAISFGALACNAYDVETEKGMKAALSEKKHLDKAMAKLASLSSTPDEIKPYGAELSALYLVGSSYDREVIQILASLGDTAYDEAYLKAANSDDFKQVQSAALAAKNSESDAVIETLLSKFDTTRDPDTKRLLMEAGLTKKDAGLAKKATELLLGDLERTPIGLLRTSCNVLAYQRDPESAEASLRGIFFADDAGRSIATECAKALTSLGKDVAGPILVEVFKLENEKLNAYVDQHPDRLTPDTLRFHAAVNLAKLRYAEGVDVMLDFLQDMKPIVAPGALVLKPIDDSAWINWGALVGTASQEIIFAINDIGVQGNERAAEVLMNIYAWGPEIAKKYKKPIDLTGSFNIEISLRVNSVRVLLENDLLTPERYNTILEALKDPSFEQNRGFRPAARASLVTDLITYMAIASKPAQLESVWGYFDKLREKELQNPATEKHPAPNLEDPYDFKPVVKRIADTKSTFELADECGDTAACYEQVLEKKDEGSYYPRIKAAYEIGKINDHKYFAPLLKNYAEYDAYGQMFVTSALAAIGTKDDIPAVIELREKLRKDLAPQIFASAQTYLDSLVIILENK